MEKSLGGEMRWADAQVLFVAAAVSNLDGPEETTTLIDNMETGRYEWNWEESVQSQLLKHLLDALPQGRHTVLFAPLVSSVGGDNSFLQGFEAELVQELSRIAGIHLLPSSGLDAYLESHSTEAQELTDAGTAMAAGRALDADIVITGYTMKSGNTLTIVIRMMDAGTGEVLTVSHAVLPVP